MSSRGHYIGEIVDELASLKAKIEERGKLGLFDLHRQIEDFYKVLLNHAFGWRLENANSKRSNAPGIDLVDKSKRIAIQVTSDGSREKIQHTLDVFDARHKSSFDRIIVLVLGRKQTSYAISESRFEFSVDNDIWDINAVLRSLIAHEIDVLQRSYEYIKKETARVRIELELPDFNGNYPSTVEKFIERIPKPQLGNLAKSKELYAKQKGSDLEPAEISDLENSFEELFNNLSNLPRSTREVYAELILNLEVDGDRSKVNFSRFRKICKFDVESEVDLLRYYEIVIVYPPEDEEVCDILKFVEPGYIDSFFVFLKCISKEASLDLRQAFISMDFRDF